MIHEHHFDRLLTPNLSRSFIIFGPRGAGKSTFLKTLLKEKLTLAYDLLDPNLDDEFQRNPNALTQRIMAAVANTPLNQSAIEWIVIDEIQKNPKLLDIVQHLIDTTSLKFALTGSSARKLKHGSANLLAGRALRYSLFPLTSFEYDGWFDLDVALAWGTLPEIYHLNDDELRSDYLRTYALTYLKEEIWAEHIVRNLDPFRKFLEIAAQSNGEIINYSNIGRDVRADTKTVQSYFDILDDTLLGFYLEAYDHSVRKQQRQNPKFYLFDMGVKRALERQLTQTILSGSYGYGKAFEHFIIAEIYRLNEYLKMDFKLSYLRTKDQAEIDLIIEHPNRTVVLVEIKSTEQVDERDAKTLQRFLPDFPGAVALLISRDMVSRQIGDVKALPWQDALFALFPEGLKRYIVKTDSDGPPAVT